MECFYMQVTDASVRSDRGKKRSTNEDSFLCDKEKGIFLVADGMGGERYGEVASRLTVEGFVDVIRPFVDDQEMTIPFEYTGGEDGFVHAMRHAVESANTKVVNFAETRRSHRGMGSTLTAVVGHDFGLYVAHVGDSRLYRLRGTDLQQMTEDHTKVQEMVREGLISKEGARTHPQKHVITRCIGRKKRYEPDVFKLDVMEDDLFLMSTDGLTDMLEDSEIVCELKAARSLETIAEALIASANAHGGIDNITVLLFRIDTSPV